MNIQYITSFGLQYISYLDKKEVYCPGTRKSWHPSLLNNRICNNILFFCVEKPHSLEHIRHKLYRDYPNQEQLIDNIINLLLENGLLRSCSDIPLEKVNLAYRIWKKYNWLEPLVYHWHTNLYPKNDYTKGNKFDQNQMSKYFKEEERPDIYKRFKNSKTIPLINKKQPSLQTNNIIFVSNRKAPIKYKTEQWSFEDFAAFCYLAFGETGKKTANHYDFVNGEYKAVFRDYSTRTSPSGGSRHPTEIYIIINNVKNVENGIYHYNQENHSIELLKNGNYAEWAKNKLLYPKNRVPFTPSIICIYTTLFERSMFRYREPRSYRVVHYDLGHLMRNTTMISRAYLRECYSGPSLPEAEIEKILNIDGVRESVMSYSAIS